MTLKCWRGTGVGAFIDVNPGMNRTGIEQDHQQEVVSLAKSMQQAGISFRGIHYYDGQRHELDLAERTTLAHRGYDQLLVVVDALKDQGIATEEVITSGTPAFPCTLNYPGFQNAEFSHRMSPGTIVYGDTTSLSQLPSAWGHQPAAIVISFGRSGRRDPMIRCLADRRVR